MKHSITFLILAISSVLGFAQESYQTQIDLLKYAEAKASVLPPTWENTKKLVLNDSVSYTLREAVEAKKMDSLWRSFLFESDRYKEMYTAVTEQSYEEVDYEALPTELLKERLIALNAKTPFQIEYNPKLESVIKQYLKHRKKGLTRIMGLSNYYFPMFERVLDKHKLPLELKYLAIVESALDPKAKSPAGASGLWQFMYETGKQLGLENNSYVDDRNDPLLSTEAAAEYLSKLHGIFEDWDLALAAYNSGPGNVSKAIRRSGGSKNYWNIRPFLPRETANYLPAFLATMYIFEYAEEHGIFIDGPSTPIIATDTIHVKKMISFEHIHKATDIPLNEIQHMNPAYKLGIIPYVEDKPHALRLPLEAVGTFVANEEAVYAFAQEDFDKKEKPNPELINQPERVRYRVKNGDYLGKIANQYKVSVSQLKQWNNLRNNNLRIGQVLIVFPNI